MLYKYAYSNRITKERKLYVLMAIGVPILVAAVILAFVGGYLRGAVDAVITLVWWGGVAVIVVWGHSRRREAGKTYHAAKITPRLRRVVILFERTLWLLALVGGVTGLPYALVTGKPLYLILEGVWLIVIGAGHFFFVSLVPDEWIVSRKS